MLIDSHVHLDRLDLSLYDGKLDNVIANAQAQGVNEMLCVSVDLTTYPQMLDTIRPYPFVHASCGQHPLYQESLADPEQLLKLAQDEKVVAIGETGLDAFYAPETLDVQTQSFIDHVAVATQINKPLIIHTRDARQQTIDILKQGHADRVGGVLHCFTETLEMAKQAMDLGFYISMSGIVTFKNASELRDVVRALPLDRLLVETDAPYLAPVPHRGKENQPAFVRDVAQYVADLKQVSLEELATVTSNNFRTLFLQNR
ncbi:TatD family hydrolase [Psychrobium sp. 1_MG-2023]|uniref:TatD family hydrolase n=1 Tax=Psychrobium sp. 1_MG-2023 TaxID=3062624 RepID=UPI000C33C0AD|nr:TatD family hydrolase [Psychrobium sp. 1_MG-2023]MDP2561687.1 TatD family hydrolase [Psychrobium sp. 1_MG-2023]PKF57091.1 metal-dependent hydrolase [Alteromonadales bacterium alter-6D02]